MAGSRKHAVAVVLGASALALVACDAILDLGQYNNDGQCSYDCDAGGESSALPPHDAAPDSADSSIRVEGGADAEGGGDGGADVEAGPVMPPDAGWPVPTGHEIWAHWPMPNPDASLGPESSTALPHAMAYDAGADGGSPIAYDAVTKLSWWRQALPAPTYDTAWNGCYDGLSPKGTWRLPTRIELVSLIDFTQVPTLQAAMFPDAGGVVWTSSAVAGGSGYWAVDFSTGLTVATTTMTPPSWVLCVSGGTP